MKDYEQITIRDDIQPWERQLPRESELMYSRFLVYRDLGPETERLRQSAEVLNASGDSISYKALKDYSSIFRWASRAAAWDRYVMQADVARMVKLRREAIDEQRKLARQLRSRAVEAMEILPAADMSPADAARYAELSWKIEKSIFQEYESASHDPAQQQPTSTSEQPDAANWSPHERRKRLEQLRDELADRAARAADDDEVVA